MEKNRLRNIPSVEKLLSDPGLSRLYGELPRERVTEIVRRYLAGVRAGRGETIPSSDGIIAAVVAQVEALLRPALRPVINATGVILHTNLGRAPMSEETIAAMAGASRGYSNLEFDLTTGKRGSRQTYIEPILSELTGAESAIVVNNNAAALLLAMSALANRREVIVSRGQGVQIGDGFRIPDVMQEGGAKLVEVGTTNCTYITDYEQAVTPRTAAFLRVHSSNFKIIGFVHSVDIPELAGLGKRLNLPVFDDVGSGCLIDTSRYGMDKEPVVQESIAGGADLVLFSGDKLLGGPQAGIVVGRKDLITRMKRHPLARAVRIDKTRLAGLEATLVHYLKGEAETKVPVLRMIAMPPGELERRARDWASEIGEAARVERGESMVGGGSLPESTLPTYVVAVHFKSEAGVSRAVAALRNGEPPVVARAGGNALLLDPRTVFPAEDSLVVKAVRRVLAESSAGKNEDRIHSSLA